VERSEQRQVLKKLQGIVNNRNDADAMAVVDEVREYVGTFPHADATAVSEDEVPEEARVEEDGRDRQESKGRTRKG